MVKAPVSQSDAQLEYDKLGYRTWNVDSFPGMCAALEAFMFVALVRRFHRKVRYADGNRTRRDEAEPAWVPQAFADLKRAVSDSAVVSVVVHMLAAAFSIDQKPTWALLDVRVPGMAQDLVEGLFVRGKNPAIYDPSSPGYRCMEGIAAHHKRLKRRASPELRAFFQTTREDFHALGRGEPTAKVLALLCAARGIQPIEDSMKQARKRWDDRLTRWRAEMDNEDPEWRSKAIAWDGSWYKA
jgi:hypothetical protein